MAKVHYSLNTSFETNGYWWLPEYPDNKVAGKIFFDPCGDFSLHLLGSLSPKETFNIGSVFKADIINGILEDGKECTLINAIQTRHSFGSILTNSTFALNIAIIGWIFKSIEDVKFNATCFELTNLNNWVLDKCFKTDQLDGNIRNIEYCRPKEAKFSIKSLNSTLSICSNANFKTGLFDNEIHHQSYIRVRPKKKKNLDWFLETIYGVQNLLAIFTAERIFNNNIRFEVKREKSRHKSNKMTKIYADVIFKQPHYADSKKIHPLEIPFNFKNIKTNFQKITDSWFAEKMSNTPIYDVFFNSFYNTS